MSANILPVKVTVTFGDRTVKQGYHFTEQSTEEFKLIKKLSRLSNRIRRLISNPEAWQVCDGIYYDNQIIIEHLTSEKLKVYSQLHTLAPERW